MLTWKRNPCAPAVAAAALFAGCSSLAPCDHRDLEGKYGLACVIVGYRDQPQRSERGCLRGTVTAAPSDTPIVVFVYRQRGQNVQVIESVVLPQSGQFSFAVPAGVYRVAAFVDDDGDSRFDPRHEPAALFHGGHPVAVSPGQRVDRLDLTVRRDQPQRVDFTFSLPAGGEPSDQRCAAAKTST